MIISDIPNPQNLFTIGSFTTLAASTAMVYTACGVIQQVFNFSPKWLALAISMMISAIACYISITTTNQIPEKDMTKDQLYMHTYIWLNWALAIFNGFLIYAAVSGSNQIISNPQPPAIPPLAAKPKRKFNTNWWH